MSNEGKTWGFQKPDGTFHPAGYSCQEGRWEVFEDTDFMGDPLPPEERFVKSCRMRSQAVKCDACPCGLKFIYP